MKYLEAPEIIGTIDEINSDADEKNHGDRVIGIQCRKERKESQDDAAIDIDVRDFPRKGSNLVVRVQLKDLMLALTCAALNHQEP